MCNKPEYYRSTEYDEPALMLDASCVVTCIFVRQWVGPPAARPPPLAPTVVGGRDAGAALEA